MDGIEYAGNKLPDPAILFLLLLGLVWMLSLILSPFDFAEIDPRTGQNIEIINLLTGSQLAAFLASMVNTFVTFAPLGIVLVAMLGVGVAEHSGYINTAIKYVLSFTPKALLTPVLILVAIVSHTATDAGYVLVIPLGGVIFTLPGDIRLLVLQPLSPVFQVDLVPILFLQALTHYFRVSRNQLHRSLTRIC